MVAANEIIMAIEEQDKIIDKVSDLYVKAMNAYGYDAQITVNYRRAIKAVREIKLEMCEQFYNLYKTNMIKN